MQPEDPRIVRFSTRASNAAREHYIPLRRDELVERLAADDDLGTREQQTLRSFGRLLAAMLHREYHARLEQLKAAYAPFDPDAPNRPQVEGEAERKLSDQVFARFADLLERANFRKLSAGEVKAALGGSSRMSVQVDVDFSLFERVDIFVRGDVVGRWDRPEWRRGYRAATVDIPIYERLALIFRPSNHVQLPPGMKPGIITLKLFKNIPQMDVEMLLPGSRVRMTWFDRVKIIAPTCSGLALAMFKIFKGAVVLAFASIYGLLALIGFVGGTIGYGVRAFFGYLNTKEKYHLNLTRSLYFQNLDNNAGVLFRLLDEAEDQDFREAMLAWFVLWRTAGSGGWTTTQIDDAAEEKLHAWLGHDVDFEVHDALDKLQRLGLIERLGPERWRAAPLSIAMLRLERLWNDLNPFRDEDVRNVERAG